MSASLVNLTIFLPLLGIPALMFLPAKNSKLIALGFSAITFILSLLLLGNYQASLAESSNGFAFFQSLPWISTAGIDITYSIGLDGVSLWMVLLTTLLFPLLTIYAWNRTDDNVRMFFGLMLLMETAILGFFFSLDMILFYVFFEMVLIPAIFFIGIWGSERRRYATLKFFLYTLAGSLVMLIGILYMGNNVPGVEGFTSDYFLLQNAGFDVQAQGWLFLAFMLAFGIKAPIFPLHTWQADAYSESSTTGTIIMAAILSKMGVYGMIRFVLPLFPDAVAAYAPYVSVLAVIGILYGAMVAFAQDDMKRLLAYSSLSHIGFIVLGIFALQSQATSGAVLQMLAHGVSTAALFFLVGMIESRGGSRKIADYRGIAKKLPVFAFLFVISVMASVGLPGLSGFVGEFMIMLGAFNSTVIGQGFTIFAALGVIAAAVYLLYMTRKVLFGNEESSKIQKLSDLKMRETGLLIPLVILMFIIGFYATPFLKPINQTVIKEERSAQVELPVKLEEAASTIVID
ncbi:MAG: NuoM family protein [Bacteroidia bacterium]